MKWKTDVVEFAAKHTGRSPQSKQLRRRLSLQLALSWLIYTAVFLVIALVLNATVVPNIANRIADTTSQWQTWDFDDYSLERCLAITGSSFAGVAPTSEEAEAAVQDLNQLQIETDTDDSVSTDSAFDASVSVPLETDLNSHSILVLKDRDGRYRVSTLGSLKEDAVRTVMYESGVTSDDWQVLVDDKSIEARDLSFYNLVKQLKIPVAVMLYLIGCIVLIFWGYGQAMRYFDVLSGAVGEIIANRKHPVELPPALSLTQEELESIRLASLADERAAQYAERRKDELVAYLAHDVKTPLTSVIGYLMLLEEAPDMPAEQRQHYIGIAADKAQRLETLMDEFFEITRYNLQAIPIERSHIDAKLLLEQVADEFYPDAQAREMTITVEAPEDAKLFVDANKLARALGNIVRNAVAYADSGSEVKIAAHEDDDCAKWHIAVTNQGREISDVHLKSIFEKFYREDTSRSSSSGGAGLGLAIAKEIVVAHGGTIEAQSKDGATIFAITLPR